MFASCATVRVACIGWNRWWRWETADGRIAYGPVQATDVAALFDADFLHGGEDVLALGLTEEIPWLKSQQRLTFARVGVVDPRSLDDYCAHGGYRGLAAALKMEPSAIVQAVTDSRSARSWRRGFSGWYQVEDLPRRWRGSEIHRMQCGRGRLGYVFRSHDHGRRSVRLDRRA